MNNRQLFFNHLAQTSLFPLALEIEKAEGCYLFGTNGEKYLDLISGISVSNVGHRHPWVIQKIKEQLDKYLHVMVYGELIQSPQVLLAHKLSTLLPWKENTQTYLVNSGSEAIEGAIKLAKRYTQKTHLISFKNAYHGSTQGALSLMGDEQYKQAFRPLLPAIKHLEFGNMNDLNYIDENTAAVIFEPVQGEAGVITASESYYRLLQNRCKKVGALLIADEIQTGFGRTGSWFAFEQFNILPDIVVMAKGLGGGMPIGAFSAHKNIMNCLTNNPILGHITTFGGHPVCAAAALASIQVIENEQLIKQVQPLNQLFINLLKHKKIKAVRAKGLMIAVQLNSFGEVQNVINYCLKRGLFLDWFLFCNTALRIAPPLIISQSDVEQACATIIEALQTI
jgi:acetylornithine/succinyldiaminopimelate/putrescine aminotransferase